MYYSWLHSRLLLGVSIKKKKRGGGSFKCSCYVRFPLEVFYCLLVATCKRGNLSSTVFFKFCVSHLHCLLFFDLSANSLRSAEDGNENRELKYYNHTDSCGFKGYPY